MHCYISTVYVLFILRWFETGQAIPPPGPPQHVSIVSDVSNIGVQWEPPTETYGDIRNYIVSWTILPNSTELTNIVGGDVRMSIISVQGHLGRLFRIWVRAENAGGIGPHSLPKYTRLECGKSYDLFPGSNVTVTSPGFKTGSQINPGVFCTWTFKTLAKYSLEVCFDELELTDKDYRGCSDTYIDISGVGRLCDKKYAGKDERTSLQSLKMTLKSGVNAGGRGFRVTIKSVKQLPGSPTQIVLRTSDHAVLIRWQPPRESTLPVSAYRIRYVVAHSRQFMVTVAKNMRQFPINTDRFEGKVITIRLSALIGAQEGKKSRAYIARAPCRRRLHLNGSNSVNITSPGYPRAYPSNIICMWYIASDVNVTSFITYLDFRLEDTLFCSSDFLTFSFRTTTENECSQMVLPKTIKTNTQNYIVTFVTDGQNEFPGFLIQIRSKGIAVLKKVPKSAEKKRIDVNNAYATVSAQEIDETTTVTKRANFKDDSGGNLISSTPSDSVSTTHISMTSLVTKHKSNMPSTKSMAHRFLAATVTVTTSMTGRKPLTIKHNNSHNSFAQSVTGISNRQTVSPKYGTSYVEHATQVMSTYNTFTGYIETTSTVDAMEDSTSALNISDTTSGHHSLEQGSEYSRDNDTVLAVILSTITCAIVLLISTCYFRWRRRHRQMKINIEPAVTYRATNIELHDILEIQQQRQPGDHNSRIYFHNSRDASKPVFATSNLETIHECPEELIRVKKDKKMGDHKRCYSFPFCFSTRRRKIHKEIQNSLEVFGFIEDKKSLEKTLQRKHCLRRTNSL